MDTRLRDRAEAQSGVFTWQDVTSLLLRPWDLRTAITRGEVVRVRRDAYVLADLWREARPTERLALRVRACLRSRKDVVATHQSALALHGLPCWGMPTDVVDACAPVGRTRTAAGLRIHPQPEGLEPTDVDGTPAVSISLAIAQVARRHGIVPALVALDRALHERRCRLPDVLVEVDRVARSPREAARLEAMLSRADAACESVGEIRTRLLLEDLGYSVRSQVRVSDEDGRLVGRVDFMIDDCVVVEFDGMVKYEGAEGRSALVAEKRREELLTALGCVVIRLVWADLDHPQRIRSMVEAARQRARRP